MEWDAKKVLEIRTNIRECDAGIRQLQRLRWKWERECPHIFPLTKKEQKEKETDRWWSKGAYCDICGQGFGWLCKESPDGVCHYFSQDGFVEGIHGEKIPVPEGYDNEKWETNDLCIFCGMPDERK